MTENLSIGEEFAAENSGHRPLSFVMLISSKPWFGSENSGFSQWAASANRSLLWAGHLAAHRLRSDPGPSLAFGRPSEEIRVNDLRPRSLGGP